MPIERNSFTECWVGLVARGRDIRQQRQMDINNMTARQIIAELADRLEKRQPFDVADRPADLDQDEVDPLIALENELLDGVGHMRDHLHRCAEEIAAPLLGDQLLVDAARGDIVLPVGVAAGKTLVMAEVEIGLGPVVGDEHLSVLGRAHRARVDIEIGVEFSEPDGVAARLQKRAQSC
jgi:hypothetical protein